MEISTALSTFGLLFFAGLVLTEGCESPKFKECSKKYAGIGPEKDCKTFKEKLECLKFTVGCDDGIGKQVTKSIGGLRKEYDSKCKVAKSEKISTSTTMKPKSKDKGDKGAASGLQVSALIMSTLVALPVALGWM